SFSVGKTRVGLHHPSGPVSLFSVALLSGSAFCINRNSTRIKYDMGMRDPGGALDNTDMQGKDIPPIESDRLQLVSMSLEFLRLIIARRFDAAQEISDFGLPSEPSLADKLWLKRRIRMVEDDPTQHPWM